MAFQSRLPAEKQRRAPEIWRKGLNHRKPREKRMQKQVSQLKHTVNYQKPEEKLAEVSSLSPENRGNLSQSRAA